MRTRGAAFVFVLALALRAAAANAEDIAAADLRIAGSGLVVVDTAVDTGIDIPTSIRTEFGGKRDDEAPFVPGLIALADLSGPGVAIPITLEAAPGHAFRIPGLGAEGVYTLANIRLAKEG
ncbi:MAG TPA: hypothetical protein VFV54_07745, partial [Thermoanaerobaculia bacterium]|nr:hypothetical protein [Thermoanaerobaculia bacterium]